VGVKCFALLYLFAQQTKLVSKTKLDLKTKTTFVGETKNQAKQKAAKFPKV
jgi:hypothetical protein